MKIYIAGPMTGLPDWNYPAFHAAARAWRAYGWEVVNPAEAFGGATDRPYRDYVAADIEVLRHCDAIAMLPGWDGPNARGSVWEREVAKTLLKLPVYNAAYPSQVRAPAVTPITRGPDGTLGRWPVQMDLFENSYGQGK
jgi:hypothetical protein